MVTTDDEREALVDNLRATAGWLKRANNPVDTDRVMRAIRFLSRTAVQEPREARHICPAHPFGCPEPQGEPTDDEREARDKAMDEAWGFRAETRPVQEKWNAQHWFDAGWRAALRRTAVQEPSADDEREELGWREAALYAGDADAQDDFMTGWRTSDRLRPTAVQEPRGEPTDAQVHAAADAIARARGYVQGACLDEHYRDARAALTAVYETKGEGR